MMLRKALIAGVSLAVLATAATAQDIQKFDAVLKAHAQLPAQSFLVPPADAPAYFAKSGRFTGGARQEQVYSNFDANSGLGRPFAGQPLQGFSGIRSLGGDRFLVLTDNGFGNMANSADAMLMFNIFKIDWTTGKLAIEKTVFLSDPNMVVPFPITSETSETRYLTGADFDVESIQPVGDHYFLADEFGPWVIEVDAEGVVLRVIATKVAGTDYKSPDNQTIQAPAPGTPSKGVNSQRSGGYEGMAVSPDGSKLYPLLEKTIYDEAAGAFELLAGKPVLRIFELDAASGEWSDKVRFYPIEDPSHSIGDFNMIDEHRALIIERDQNEGDTRDGREKGAKFKRIYLVDLDQADAGGIVRKLGYIDLLDIKDADGLAPRGTSDGVFSFPFVTIEDVDMVDATTIVVANDNNYPGSTGREQGRADDNEFVLLDVAEFLKAE
jgi:hypothetical protein